MGEPVNLSPESTGPISTTPTVDVLHLERQIAISSIALAVVLLVLLVACSVFLGCFRREYDDAKRDETRLAVVKEVIDEQIMRGAITHVDGATVLNKWRNSYYQKSKPRRCCKFMCFKMNQKQFKQNMMQQFGSEQTQRRQERVTPQWQVQDNPPQKCDEVKPYAHTYEQSDSDSEPSAPFPSLTAAQWQIKQTKSQRMFTCGDWEKFKDNESQYCYYYNHTTKEWQWEKPDGYVEDDNADVSHRPLSKSEWKIKQTKSQRRF